MKNKFFKNYFALFILGVLIIAVYKTFDNIGVIFKAIGSFLDLLTPFIIAFVFAFLLHPICRKIESLYKKRNLKFLSKNRRILAVLSVVFIFILIIGLILGFIIPTIGTSIAELKKFFVDDLPANIVRLVNKFNEYGLYFGEPHTAEYWLNLVSAENLIKYLSVFSFNDISKYAGKIVSYSTGIVDVVMAIIIAVYILIDRESLKEGFTKFVNHTIGEKHRGRLYDYLRMTIRFLYKYIYCALIDAFIVFVLSFVALYIIGVDYSLVLALIVGVSNLVPYFGAIVGSVIVAIVIMLTKGIYTALIAVVTLIILQQIDANIIQPRLINHSFSLKPFWVIFGVLVGGGFFGMWGILLAVPAMALIKEIFEDYYEWSDSRKNQTLTKE